MKTTTATAAPQPVSFFLMACSDTRREETIRHAQRLVSLGLLTDTQAAFVLPQSHFAIGSGVMIDTHNALADRVASIDDILAQSRVAALPAAGPLTVSQATDATQDSISWSWGASKWLPAVWSQLSH